MTKSNYERGNIFLFFKRWNGRNARKINHLWFIKTELPLSVLITYGDLFFDTLHDYQVSVSAILFFKRIKDTERFKLLKGPFFFHSMNIFYSWLTTRWDILGAWMPSPNFKKPCFYKKTLGYFLTHHHLYSWTRVFFGFYANIYSRVWRKH